MYLKHAMKLDSKIRSLTKEEKEVFYDPSFWGVIGSNLFSIGMALKLGWNIHEIMWIYWAQSVVIGIMNVIRILMLKEFSTKGFHTDRGPVPETMKGKIHTALFFIVHYGGFHAFYAAFLWQDRPLNTIDPEHIRFLVMCIMTFFIVHAYSLRHNLTKDFKDKKPNLGNIMLYPYLRIVPMHLTIIMGSAWPSTGAAAKFILIFFMVLKTLADAGMHMVEHSLFRQPDKKPKIKN